MNGYGDALDWRGLGWALREMGENYMSFGWTRSGQDLWNLWFDREKYVRKYYPELLNG